MTLHQTKEDKCKHRVKNENAVYCRFRHVAHVFLFKPNERVVLKKFIHHESIYNTIQTAATIFFFDENKISQPFAKQKQVSASIA